MNHFKDRPEGTTHFWQDGEFITYYKLTTHDNKDWWYVWNQQEQGWYTLSGKPSSKRISLIY